MCERYIYQLPLRHPQLGTWPATQVCALTGNQTCDLLVHRPTLNPLSHTSQGRVTYLLRQEYPFSGQLLAMTGYSRVLVSVYFCPIWDPSANQRLLQSLLLHWQSLCQVCPVVFLPCSASFHPPFTDVCTSAVWRLSPSHPIPFSPLLAVTALALQ